MMSGEDLLSNEKFKERLKAFLSISLNEFNEKYEDSIKKYKDHVKSIRDSNKSLTNRVVTYFRDIRDDVRQDELSEMIEKHKRFYGSQANVFDLLYEFIKHGEGNHTAHSFKFMLIKNLFGVTEEDGKNAQELIDGFISVMEDMKDDERNEVINEMVSQIKDISPKTIAESFARSYNIKAMHNWFGNNINPILSGVRSFSDHSCYDALKNNKLGPVDGVHFILTNMMGSEGVHSLKYLFLLDIFGVQVSIPGGADEFTTTDDIMRGLVIPTEPSKITRYLLSAFAKSDSYESGIIIEGLIQALHLQNKLRKKSLKEEVEGYANKLKTGGVTQTIFEEALQTVQNEKTSQREKREFDTFGPIINLITEPRNLLINHELNILFRKLGNNNSQKTMTVLEATELFLSGSSSPGPHSRKYRLLKTLFPDLNKDIKFVTEVESTLTVKYFLVEIFKAKNSENQDIQLETIESNNAELSGEKVGMPQSSPSSNTRR